MSTMITLLSPIIFHSHKCFQTNIYSLQNFLRHVINTATVRVLQKFHYNYHGDCRILANGMKIHHLECCNCLTSILGRRPQCDYPRHSLRTIYTTFFWTPTSHTLHQLSEDVLFGCFVIALNAAFTQQLSFADEGYESGSDTIGLPTPLRKTPCIHHVSSMEHVSFNPAHTTPCRTVPLTPSRFPQMPTRPVHHHLSFNSDSDQDPDSTSVHSNSSDDDQDLDSTSVHSNSSDDDQDLDSTPAYSDEEEDFPTVPLDDEHWTAKLVPERIFCIHGNCLPNNICQHLCPYGNNKTVSYMDSLSDILDYEDYVMTTSDDEELPGMEEVPY